jgi:phospholipid transport system substrate-binding protein
LGLLLVLLPIAALADTPPTAPIDALNAGLANAEKTGTQSFQDRYNALAPIVDRAFDLPQILKSIVGLRWAQIPPDQQARLLAVFRAFTISSYVAVFKTDSGDTFRTLPEGRNVGPDVVVESEIVPKQGDDPTRIDYVMRHGPGGWQAVDVLQLGTISQAAVQRSDFRGPLNDGGAPKLIESLQQKVDTLSGGAIKP